MQKTVAFCTLGCKVNQYDSQAMLERFIDAGYAAVSFAETADVYVINTCTVTGTGDQKSRQMIRRAKTKNPDAAIVVAGCLAQRAAGEIASAGAKLVLGTQQRGQIITLLDQALRQQEPLIAVAPTIQPVFEPLAVSRNEGHTRATLKIQEGCDNHCAYCVIPSVRGPARSRPLSSIQTESERLVAAGYLEIVLTGIHLTSYGKDLAPETTLLEAIQAVHSTGITRIRLGSLEPSLITESFAVALLQVPSICPQFMLALQSGSDTVLARMRRRYTTAQYERAVMLIRKYNPKAAITTDLMTGFPGETEKEFQQTLKFVESIGFARIHVFPYSEREGTVAASMPDPVPIPIREARARELIALGKRAASNYLSHWIGQDVLVLFEQACEGGASGYTPEYVRVIADGEPGHIQSVRIEAAHEGHVRGKVVRRGE